MTDIIETERLILRQFGIQDVPNLVELQQDPDIYANTLTIPRPYEEKHAVWWVNNSMNPKTDSEIGTAIVLKKTKMLIGSIGYKIDAHKRAVLGYWIGAPWRKRGFATEAAKAIIVHVFKTTDANVVCATHATFNPASGEVMKKIGMKHEGTLRRFYVKDGKPMDVERYSILREEVV